MTKKDYLLLLADERVIEEKVKKTESIYGVELPLLIKKIISSTEESIFLEGDYRLLSYDEINDAESDLHVDFGKKGIIPLIDCGDNDFIVYHFNDGIWSKYNIIEEVVFKKKNTIEEMLL